MTSPNLNWAEELQKALAVQTDLSFRSDHLEMTLTDHHPMSEFDLAAFSAEVESLTKQFPVNDEYIKGGITVVFADQ